MYGGQTAASIPSPVYLESIQHGFVATYLTDNQYLQTLIQQGIFGLGLYLYLAYQIFLKLLLANKREIIFGSCVLAIWIGYSIQGIFENIFFIQASTTAIWIIIGQGLKGIE
jgi:O-antigen ligase